MPDGRARRSGRALNCGPAGPPAQRAELLWRATLARKGKRRPAHIVYQRRVRNYHAPVMSSCYAIEVQPLPTPKDVLFSLDLPTTGTKTYGDPLQILGWAIGIDAPVTAVEATCIGHERIRVNPELSRPDVFAAFPGLAQTERCGFSLLSAVPETANGEIAVSVTLNDHQRVDVAVIHLKRQVSTSPDAADALVSVVIPYYNQGHFLRETIQSVHRQTYPRVEIVVVDDGSTEDGTAIAMDLGARCIRQENRGTAAARNRGVAEATGDYVVLLDHDDRLLPHGVEANVDAFAARSEAALVCGSYRVISASGEPIPSGYPPPSPPDDDHYRALLATDYYIVCPGQAMFRRSAFTSAGGFDRSFPGSDDWELYLRIARAHPIYVHSIPIVEYRRHGGNVSIDAARMLQSGLATVRAQRKCVRRDPSLRDAYRRGLANCREVYGTPLADDLVDSIQRGEWARAVRTLGVLAGHHPSGLRSAASQLRATRRGESKPTSLPTVRQ